MKIRHLDCFAGVGGFSLAIKNAIGKERVNTIGFSEIDKYAIATYKKNFPGVKNYGDITKIDIAALPDFDILTGGFPCQDVSVAGKQDLEGGGRTILVEYLLRMLEIKRPKYFIFENVKGIMSKKFDMFRESIFFRIKNAGYEYDYKILNSKNFGLAQSRSRFFIVGNNCGKENIISNGNGKEEKLKNIIENIYDGKYIISEKHKNSMIKSRKSKKLNIGNLDGVSGTIIASYFKIPQDGPYLEIGGGKVRKYTPIEVERLQGFPDNWTSGVSDSQRYKQIGNAISINVVEKIIKDNF